MATAIAAVFSCPVARSHTLTWVMDTYEEVVTTQLATRYYSLSMADNDERQFIISDKGGAACTTAALLACFVRWSLRFCDSIVCDQWSSWTVHVFLRRSLTLPSSLPLDTISTDGSKRLANKMKVWYWSVVLTFQCHYRRVQSALMMSLLLFLFFADCILILLELIFSWQGVN